MVSRFASINPNPKPETRNSKPKTQNPKRRPRNPNLVPPPETLGSGTINHLMELQLIQNKIYEVRGHKVMLDFDLAELYEVPTKVLNQAVKRNMQRFPSDFMFRLTIEEWEYMRSQKFTAFGTNMDMQSQNVTASQKKRNVSATPYAFTEQGLAMLSGILNSDKAINEQKA